MSRLTLPFAALALLLVPLPALADEPRCDAPRVLVVLDKSSSMLGEVPGGGTKWQAAGDAISSVTRAFADRIDFGLMIFPEAAECDPGSVVVDCAPSSADDVVDALGEPPPEGGNYTPMAQSLEVAGDYDLFADPARRSYVLLITDGWQWCYPYDAATRFTPVDEVIELHDQRGITTFVVGFGAGVDVLTLNRAAAAGGAPIEGCDPDAEEMGDDSCYFQADDLASLTAALDTIASFVTEEVCDGTDNDCDGAVDDGFDQDGDGMTTCGADGAGVDCDDGLAAVNPGHEEVCDGLDNDCDGQIDLGCECQAGESQPCGTCGSGTQACERGAWGACDEDGPPPEEQCNGADDDCDGSIDEDARCVEAGFACMDGECVDLAPDPPADEAPVAPPPEAEDAMIDGGCACRTTSPASGTIPPAIALLLLALVSRRALGR
ncbi:MAG: VWA domain-containing protein [Deltaproteobacteria bacterium]|nr:VWA domain-containing protein [Deltaproteobacteria bacterium]